MRSGRPATASTLLKVLRYHEVAAVPHGFRSSCRDWAAEETDPPREVIESAPAHAIQNKVRDAYTRLDLIELRQMDDWGAYLDRHRSWERRPDGESLS